MFFHTSSLHSIAPSGSRSKYVLISFTPCRLDIASKALLTIDYINIVELNTSTSLRVYTKLILILTNLRKVQCYVTIIVIIVPAWLMV